ncbi:unnamed protein product [Moneuplotes crassus]|uniref:Uncharacterized protein n=1 Tax=Euplotes crassus TaxID=5936 RepID=A0AAD1UBA2_EUPCR|nr:unnamed protein product [Moneuplotes crassus]
MIISNRSSLVLGFEGSEFINSKLVNPKCFMLEFFAVIERGESMVSLQFLRMHRWVWAELDRILEKSVEVKLSLWRDTSLVIFGKACESPFIIFDPSKNLQ